MSICSVFGCDTLSMKGFYEEKDHIKLKPLYLKAMKECLVWNHCVSHQCKLCIKANSIISLQNFIKKSVDENNLPSWRTCSTHWCYEHSTEKSFFLESNQAHICPYDLCRLYKEEGCSFLKADVSRFCKDVCHKCRARHSSSMNGICEDCKCCVEGCSNFNQKPVALFCEAHHRELLKSQTSEQCKICGACASETITLKKFGCNNCCCNSPSFCEELIVFNRVKTGFCHRHRCTWCLREVVPEKNLHFDKHNTAHYKPPHLVGMTLSNGMRCLREFTPENTVDCQLIGENCLGITTKKDCHLNVFQNKKSEACAIKLFPSLDIPKLLSVYQCDACRIPQCPVKDCQFLLIPGRDPKFCLFHTQPSEVCVSSKCNNPPLPYEGNLHEASWSEIFRFCSTCQVQGKQVASMGKNFHYEIYPTIFPAKVKSLIRDDRIKDFDSEFLINMFAGQRKMKTIPPYTEELHALFQIDHTKSFMEIHFMLNANVLLYQDYKSGYHTTKCQLEALRKDSKLPFKFPNANSFEVTLLMMSLLPLELSVKILFLRSH